MAQHTQSCTVDGCTTAVGLKAARGMCPRHYQRWLRNGTALSGQHCAGCGVEFDRRSRHPGPRYHPACKPPCTVDGCGQPQRKRSWCASHYAQWTRTGEEPEPFTYKWSELSPCIVCGSTEHEPGFRRFCGSACSVRYRSYDGAPPTSTQCVACGCSIDLTERGRRGHRRKSSTKFCRPCRQDYSKYKLSARELAVRDGTQCGICHKEVDMSLRRSESNMCASVDHVLPRALGGTHEPENLQLAHLYCNQVKSDLRGRKPSTGAVI